MLLLFISFLSMLFTNDLVQPKPGNNIYQFSVEGLDGETINLSRFKGKKILIVNTASQCGFTGQYKDLEALYRQYKDKLVVIGFPANNFGGQEPGSNAEIRQFCTKNYGVSFPMAAKVSVRGKDIHPLFKWLTQKTENETLDATIHWNFGKFLIDEQGYIMEYFSSRTNPLSKEITEKL